VKPTPFHPFVPDVSVPMPLASVSLARVPTTRATRARASSSSPRARVVTARAVPSSRHRPGSTACAPSLARGAPSTRGSTLARGVPALSGLPLVGWVFSAPVATIAYVFVAIKLLVGWDRTTFSASPAQKAALIGLWPVLGVLSASFRENVKRAM